MSHHPEVKWAEREDKVGKNKFRRINLVPKGNALLDFLFSKSKPQPPTVTVECIGKHFHEKLSAVSNAFPRLEQIHPFYGELLHVVYNKDHYKLALDQVNSAWNSIRTIGEEYVKRLEDEKFKKKDPLYRRQCLKVAALGRMCTVVKRITPTLAYLEKIRQEMLNLPSIDTNSPTVLICGYPKVGKSSFFDQITSADADVQTYGFTKKHLYLGHTDYKGSRYQVIRIPGILDRPFEFGMEMCSITALAHLQAAVLFFLDISGSSGYTIAQQAALFDNIQSYLTTKPLVIVCNKTDLMPLENLSKENGKLIEGMKAKGMDTVLLKMSVKTEEGVMSVKKAVCGRLKNVVDISLEPTDFFSDFAVKHAEWTDDSDPDTINFEEADFIDPDILTKLESLKLKA